MTDSNTVIGAIILVILGVVGVSIVTSVIDTPIATNIQEGINLTNGSTTTLAHNPVYNLVVMEGSNTLGNGNYTPDLDLGELTPNATSAPESLLATATYDWNDPQYISGGITTVILGFVGIFFALGVLYVASGLIRQ